MISEAVGYRIEGGEGKAVWSSFDISPSDAVPDLSDNDFMFYRDNFVDKTHTNFVAGDSGMGPVCVSIIKDDTKQEHVAVVRTRDGNTRKRAPYNNIKMSWWRKMFSSKPSNSEILKALDPKLPAPKLRLLTNPKVPQAILLLEEKQMIKGFKFGVMYAQENQTKEDEMFANVSVSPEYEEFLAFLGDRVKLENWPNFRGGLDIRNNTTGVESIYTKWKTNEIMYHVSTLLPFNPKDKQQLERKRHIGNDIVVIVFQDGNTVYRPTTISSRQVHVVFLVKAVMVPTDPGQRYYQLAVVSKDGVPDFGPPLPKDAVYKKSPEFREFFYQKLLNAELASYRAPILGNKLTRTRTALIKDLATTF